MNTENPSVSTQKLKDAFHNSIKLTTTNYLSWKTQIHAILVNHHLQNFIDATHPSPPPSNPAHLTWLQQDQLLLKALMATLSPDILPLVAQSRTSQEAWNILANTHRRRIKQLKDKLKNTSKGSQSITDYMQSIKTLADELALLGKPLDLDDLIDQVLDGLDESYQSLKDALDDRDAIITFDELREKLVSQESSLPNLGSLLPDSATSGFTSNLILSRRHPQPEHVQQKYELMTTGTGSLVLRNDGPYNLPQLLQEINNWIIATGFPKGTQILGTASQRELVMNYFSNFGGESSFSSRMDMKLRLHRDWPSRLLPGKYESICKLVVSFFQELEELFRVPQPQHLLLTDKPLGRKQIITSFICFLLQLLSLDSHSSRFPFVEDLRFLVTIIGDSPFQATEHDQVQSLLEQFEQGANLVGPLVHSLIFFRGDSNKIGNKNVAFQDLTRSIQVLYRNIEDSLHPLSNIVTPEPNSVADSLVIFNTLMIDLEDLINQGDDACVDIKDSAQTIHEMLVPCQSLLYDKSMLQYSEAGELKLLVMQIRDLACEADYLINSYTVGDAPLRYITRRFTHLIPKIVLIGTMLQEARENYYFGPSDDTWDFNAPTRVDDHVVGLDEDRLLILQELVGGSRNLVFITISGMAGLGKTTLAKEVFDSPLTRHYFDRSSWCVASHVSQGKTLLPSILIGLGSDLGKPTILDMEEEFLAERIYKTLIGRRYLIVVDDIWSADVWDGIKRYFPDNRNGSRVLFTSRHKNVAPPGSFIHELSPWSHSRCWQLLERKTFGDIPCPEELLEIGQDIASKCYGLPLAVVVIAGLLTNMDTSVQTWEKIRESLPDLPDLSESMMQTLELSYTYLPQQLKPCFLYFTVFEEDKEISVKELTHLWIAEGFVLPKGEGDKSEESVAKQYLLELIDKNLVIVAKRSADGGVKACVIHQLLREMCLRITQEENFLKVVDHDSLIWNQKFPCVRVHVNPSNSGLPSSGFQVPHGQCVRSIFGYLPDIPKILVKMKLLRVLCCRTKFKDLFGIEFLIYLRYLILDDMVPSVECLENLEFLIVNSDSAGITSDILKMAKLRYLRFQRTFFDKDCSISKSNNLEFLSCVALSNQKDVELLKNSPHLRRLKCEYLPPWRQDGVHPCLDLSFLTQLESLTITAELFNLPIAGIVFPKSIRKLTLSGFGLPWDQMSIIGATLPVLEVLKLENRAFEGKIWTTNDCGFNQLKFLKLKKLEFSSWEIEYEHFPILQRLVIQDCTNLVSIPYVIGDIATLQSIEIQGDYRKSLLKSARDILAEQMDMGNEDLKLVHMRDIENQRIQGDSDNDDNTDDNSVDM